MDRTGLTKSRAALLMGRQDRTVTYWRQAWCPQWGISRDGLEQSKHKAHLNQATRKGPTAAQRKKKALATSAANEAKKRKINNDNNNNGNLTTAENDAMAFLPGGLPPSQLMQQHHHDIPGLSQLTGLSAHHLGAMGGEDHHPHHSQQQQQQPPGLTLNFNPHQGFPGNFAALQQPFQHYIQQAPITPHHPQPQQQQQQQQQQQFQDDAAAAMAAAAGVMPKNQRRGQNMFYGL
jgi:hypothetical protein